MKRRVRFEAEASVELEAAALWYDRQHAGLGAEFLAAVQATLAEIDQWPDAAPLVTGLPAELRVRGASVRRFPYRIAYLTIQDTIRVLAVAHTRRKPRYWEGRAAPPDEITGAVDT